MAPEALPRGRMMRVRAALALSPLDGRGKLGAGVVVKCAVGEIDAAQDSPEESCDIGRVAWVHGGASHEAAHLLLDQTTDCCWFEVPLSAVHRLSSHLSDDAALLVSDMAAAIHVAKIVKARQLKTLAIVASPAATCLAHLLVWHLEQVSGAKKSDLAVHIVLLGEISAAVANSWKSFTSVTVHRTTGGADTLLLDGCIDLCGVDTTLDFATRQLEPLGTLVLLASDPLLAPESTRIDMNTVVVNELSIVNVGDFRGELSDAVEVLTTHVEAFTTLVSLWMDGTILRAS